MWSKRSGEWTEAGIRAGAQGEGGQGQVVGLNNEEGPASFPKVFCKRDQLRGGWQVEMGGPLPLPWLQAVKENV